LFKFYKYRRLVNDYTIDDVRSPSVDSVALYLARVTENTEEYGGTGIHEEGWGGKGEGIVGLMWRCSVVVRWLG